MRYFSLLLMLGALWLTTATHSHFSQDSWSYYELSRHIFHDFYHINSWRQFHINSEYGVSFPPLWPALIASVNSIVDVGIYAGFVLNFIIAALTFPMLRRMSIIWFGDKEIGSLLFFALMITPDYTTALFSAGTLPLSLLLLLIILYFYSTKRYVPAFKAVLLGILAGLSVLNRFDFLLPALVMGFFIRPLTNYYITLLIAISPWMGYSITHFGTIWITDNSRTILSSIPIFVRDYYAEAVPMLWNDPLGWVKKTIGAVIKSADVLFTATTALPWVMGITLLITRQVQMNKNMLFFGALIFVQVASILLTGFVETRYYVPLQFFLLVALLWLALPIKIPTMFTRAIPAIFMLLSIAYTSAYLTKSFAQSAPISLKFNANNREPTEFAKLLGCMKNEGSILLPPKNYSYKFGALTGITSYIEPTNISSKNAKEFITKFKPAYLLTATPRIYSAKSQPLCTFNGWGESDATYYFFRISPL